MCFHKVQGFDFSTATRVLHVFLIPQEFFMGITRDQCFSPSPKVRECAFLLQRLDYGDILSITMTKVSCRTFGDSLPITRRTKVSCWTFGGILSITRTKVSCWTFGDILSISKTSRGVVGHLVTFSASVRHQGELLDIW